MGLHPHIFSSGRDYIGSVVRAINTAWKIFSLCWNSVPIQLTKEFGYVVNNQTLRRQHTLSVRNHSSNTINSWCWHEHRRPPMIIAIDDDMDVASDEDDDVLNAGLTQLKQHKSNSTEPLQPHLVQRSLRRRSFKPTPQSIPVVVCPVIESTIYYQHARGLRTKYHQFFSNSLSCYFDMIILTWRWCSNCHEELQIHVRAIHNQGNRQAGVCMHKSNKTHTHTPFVCHQSHRPSCTSPHGQYPLLPARP